MKHTNRGDGNQSSPVFFRTSLQNIAPYYKITRYPIKQDVQELQAQKVRQLRYCNQHGRDLRPIAPGETVSIQLLGQKTLSFCICKAPVGPRSYEVKVGDAVYRQNFRQVIRTDELVDTDDRNLDPQTTDLEEDMDNSSTGTKQNRTTTMAPQEQCTLHRF